MESSNNDYYLLRKQLNRRAIELICLNAEIEYTNYTKTFNLKDATYLTKKGIKDQINKQTKIDLLPINKKLTAKRPQHLVPEKRFSKRELYPNNLEKANNDSVNLPIDLIGGQNNNRTQSVFNGSRWRNKHGKFSNSSDWDRNNVIYWIDPTKSRKKVQDYGKMLGEGTPPIPAPVAAPSVPPPSVPSEPPPPSVPASDVSTPTESDIPPTPSATDTGTVSTPASSENVESTEEEPRVMSYIEKMAEKRRQNKIAFAEKKAREQMEKDAPVEKVYEEEDLRFIRPCLDPLPKGYSKYPRGEKKRYEDKDVRKPPTNIWERRGYAGCTDPLYKVKGYGKPEEEKYDFDCETDEPPEMRVFERAKPQRLKKTYDTDPKYWPCEDTHDPRRYPRPTFMSPCDRKKVGSDYYKLPLQKAVSETRSGKTDSSGESSGSEPEGGPQSYGLYHKDKKSKRIIKEVSNNSVLDDDSDFNKGSIDSFKFNSKINEEYDEENFRQEHIGYVMSDYDLSYNDVRNNYFKHGTAKHKPFDFDDKFYEHVERKREPWLRLDADHNYNMKKRKSIPLRYDKRLPKIHKQNVLKGFDSKYYDSQSDISNVINTSDSELDKIRSNHNIQTLQEETCKYYKKNMKNNETSSSQFYDSESEIYTNSNQSMQSISDTGSENTGNVTSTDEESYYFSITK